MKCPSCQHVSKDKAPKFCSECGQKMFPAARAPDPENHSPEVPRPPEGEMESGQELKEEGAPFSGSSDLGSSDLQETADDLSSGASWTFQRSKKKKKRKKNNQDTSTSGELDSLSLPPSSPRSLKSLTNPGSQSAAPPQSQAQQEGLARVAPRVVTTPLGRPAPQEPTLGGVLPEGRDRGTPQPVKGRGLPQKEAGPNSSASKGRPGKEDTAWELLLPESKGEGSEPGKEGPPRAPASRATDATVKLTDLVNKAGKEVKTKTQKTKPSPTSVPASQEHLKETEAARTAMRREEAGADEKANQEDAKKTGGSKRTQTATSVKDKDGKDQRSQRASAWKVESPLNPEEGITVFFHAIISKHFEFNPSSHQVFVRGGEEFGKPEWDLNVCEMYCTKNLCENGSLVEGSTIIAKQHLDKPIPYKYIIMRNKDTVEYEFIYEYQHNESEPVNRCLLVRSSLLCSGDWHQYDDIICMRPPGKFQRFVDYFTDGTKRDVVRGKKMAAAVMLDGIFSVLQTWSLVNLKSFFAQFEQFYAVVRVPMIYEGRARPWSSLQYKEEEVKRNLWEYLKKQMAPFLDRHSDRLPEDCPVRSALRMGLIVLFLAEKLNYPLSEHELARLCGLLCSNAESPDAFHAELSHILETGQSWRRYLVDLCRMCVDRMKECWVPVLPLLHHCMELAPQRKDLVLQPEDTWAALEGIPFSEYREKIPDGRQLLQLMERKRHLLHVDKYLFRSWLSVLPLRSLVPYVKQFSDYLSCRPACVLDCLLGTCYRFQGLEEVSYRNAEAIENVLKMLLKLLDAHQDRILEEPLTVLQSYLTVCLKLHESTCKITKEQKYYEMPALSAEMVCRIIKLKPLVASAEGQGNEMGKKNSVKAVFQDTLTTTRTWLKRIFRRGMFQNTYERPVSFVYHDEIEVWRRLVEMPFPLERWRESLLGDMEGRIKQGTPLAQISVFCSTQWVSVGPEDRVSKCFQKCVIEAVSSACQSNTSILERISSCDLWKLGTLVSAVITKSWPRINGEVVVTLDEVLKHLLFWPDTKHVLKLFGTNKTVLANITENGKKLMAVVDNVLAKVTGDLLSGTILVGQLELILKHMNHFLDIWQLQRESISLQEKKHDMKKVLDWRRNELIFLMREKRCVDSLLKMCGKVKHLIKVDLGEIAARHSEDLSSKRLSEATTVRSSLASSDQRPTTHYSLSPQVEEMARQLSMLMDSHVFQIFWAEAARALSASQEEEEEAQPALQPGDVYRQLYRPCFERFTGLYQDLKSGEITFGEVDATFKDFVDRYSHLSYNLQIMCALDPSDPRDWITERVEQIKEYHHLHQAVSSAQVVMEAKENLGLTGDFSVLHTLLSFTDDFEDFRHQKLDQISKQLISAKKLLQGIDEARCRCLRELSLRTEFIGWVREALGGITELKVFVDLASISAGENDIDVDRVACFHDAVQGYSPLLYKLDTSAGFDELMMHLKELWKALENDQHLPSKLRDSARNLEWLKTVKESHGSVELSSLSLATAINNKGVYVIEAPADGQKISPDTVLHLTLPESHGDQEEVRDYSLEELKELLNKLMLMSGRKDHNSTEVEVFSEVFCSVQRLVQAFIDLHSAGNMLFRAWKARVSCAPQDGVSIRMDFCLELVGQLTGSGPVARLLEALCLQMEKFLEEWKEFVAEKRAAHFYLNYYTAEQLVYLSTELKKQAPSAAALTMLSFIRGNCSPGDVAQACSGPASEATRQRERTVVEELPLLLFSAGSLGDKLQVLTQQSLACMSAFLPHCLDLEALGCGLAQLASMGGPPVQRQLPKGLQAGQPNLIVCGHSEVLPAALAIYMHTPDQPLPTYDEVLLCTPGTTFEEVALLLHRCLVPGSLGCRVYSLLFTDLLSYEVACQAEALFLRLCTKCHREDYQLLMVCDSEREHSYLPSAFSRHKVLVVPQAPLEAFQAYLARHYQVPEQTLSAAAVCRDRMCVGIVVSKRAGVGKSLYVKRLHDELERKFGEEKESLKIIRLIDPQVDENQVLGSLLPFLGAQYQSRPMIFHFDVTSSVQTGVWAFLFKLLILQYLMDVNGKMWLRNPCHLYIIEILEGSSALPKRSSKLSTRAPQFSFLDIFPKVTCRPPKEVIDMELNPGKSCRDPGMDQREFCSETFQRPYQYLKRFHQKQDLDMFRYKDGLVEGTPEECLQHFLIYCGMINPSWSELRNFACVLNHQLRDCEDSDFCNPEVIRDTLVGFKTFVVAFMILMARDFATPTLQMLDESPGKHMVTMDGATEEDLAPFSLRKRWESEAHPYVFFNSDHTCMTFIGFHFQLNTNGSLDAINLLSREVIKKEVMTVELYQALLLQGVPFNVDFDKLPRHEKLEKLCLALGIQQAIDPDETYELTTDNMLKILAIEMRFRCGIPVIVMGETGCGKTRLIKFLSDLRRGAVRAETMKLVKVHGGTTADMIYSKVREAEELARFNKDHYELDTILFFDEANTTEAVSCIKEVLCDRTVGGQPLAERSGLHIIAACNPYRKHSQELICRLESAGLGYRVRAEETADRLGSIPLRQLVYRVHALPSSLIPLVWDFGQLNDTAEKLYIQQIVQRLVDSVGIEENEMRVIADVLSASQGFMRGRGDECSFVSLRDVERCVRVFRWFYDHSEMLLSRLDSFLCESPVGKGSLERNPVLWSLVLAIGVCYHASLEKKDSYRTAICRFLPEPYNDSKVILDEITRMQDLFLSGVSLRKTIAKNLALKENVFMMVICIELKIPLFLVGKPGSSKSLAKTIVADAMQGQAAHSDLFRSLKQVHLVSFQCSPHSTPQGIIGTFRQCARFQQGKDLQQYVSVVVLDEVGLAEDSPKMPLKALHPLLEDGCIEDNPDPHKKVGFIGISNWALDPAKMNRGIFVSRGSPSEEELIESARGICSSEPLVQERVQGYFAAFAKAYEKVCERQDKEFFGLRDYYSLIKMVFAMARASHEEPSPQDVAQAVLRNFSGKDDIHALDIFTASLPEARCSEDISTLQLIEQNMYGDRQQAAGGEPDGTESRYLLVLTRNYVALQILQQAFFGEDQQPEIIFGSSFPRDQEYIQICRNINRVKICMETGKMVVLLNLHSLYESLYDALNQYYVYLGGQKYVDLGLGTHRVKCRVHPDFRLVVIEEKDVVYRHFPVPLINRLEKHYLDINTVLEKWQKNIVEELKIWVDKFVDVNAGRFLGRHRYSPSDVFIGFHSDACASVTLQVTERLDCGVLTHDLYQKVSEAAKLGLLACATPDAVVRLSASSLGLFAAQSLSREYYHRQHHNSFADFLQAQLRTLGPGRHVVFTEITTFSRLLTSCDCEILESEIKGRALKLSVLSLQLFYTEYSFLRGVRDCLTNTAKCKVLIIQTDFEDGVRSAQLIASAKYSAINEINKIEENQDCILVYFITKLSRMGSGTSYVGFHGGLWQSVHIDDLRRSTIMVSNVTKLQDVAISQLFKPEGMPELEMPGPRGQCEELMETEPNRSGDTAEEEMETGGPEALGSGPCELGEGDMAQIVDTTTLLRSCIQSAVGMLRDQSKSCQRNMKRVEILLGLLTEEDEFKATFLRVSKMRLYVLLTKQEESYICNMKEWVVREALNLDALQEAGTFRHTLWKRIQGAVTPLLASIISFIDRDGNLELLTRPGAPSWVRPLWMFIFRDTKLLNIPLVANDTRSRGEMPYIMVQSHMNLSWDTCSSVPFSWRIRDYLEELWIQAQYITGAEGQFSKLVEIFQQTPLGSFLAQLGAQQQAELLQGYLQDFLLLTVTVSSQKELLVLHMALSSCINQLKAEQPEQELSLPWVHLAYQHFRSRLQNFSRILTICPQIPQALFSPETLHDYGSGHELILDIYVAMACAEMLIRDILKPSPQAWLQLVKRLAMPMELLCSDGYTQGSRSRATAIIGEVRTHWNRIFSIALFVEHVLLGTESQLPELRPLVTEYVFLLSKCLEENSDIKTHRPFVAVMTTLCKCKDQASRTFSRFGVQPCPICLEDAQDPVCLPCDHVHCLRCMKTLLTQGDTRCTLCLADLPENFSPVVSQEHRNAIEKHSCFRQLCNSFFVDLVSTVCFKDNSPPQKSVVDDLLSLLFVKKEFLRDASQRYREHTKSLSPFDDVVDRTPVIRSVVLKLLLKYSFHEVKDYIQTYLSLLEEKACITEDKSELYLLVTNCLEDSMHEKNTALSASAGLRRLREEGQFLRTYASMRLGREPACQASVEHLQDVARIRLCLDRASDFLSELQEGSAEMAEEKRSYLGQVRYFCTEAGNDWFRVYLVRKLTSQQGMECVQSFSRQGHPAQWVFPKEVIAQQKDYPGQMDRFLVHGDEYKALRDAVGKAVLECKPLAIVTALEASSCPLQAAHLLLALFREVTVLFRSPNAHLHPKPEQCEALNRFIEESEILSPPDIRLFATSLVSNTLPLLMGPREGGLEGAVTEMAVHAAIVLLCGKGGVLEPLRNLAFFPDSMAEAFLPTMPEDLLAQAAHWTGLEGVRWYTCPNGHPCSVGECGLPMEQSFCVDCHAPIGGTDHKPLDEFHLIDNGADRTQTGHVLGYPQRRGEAVVSDRQLSPAAFLVLRLLTHLAMLWGAAQNHQALVNIIKPPVRDPKEFLQLHIHRNLEHLAKTLGRSADESISAVHVVLCGLLRGQQQRPDQCPVKLDPTLSTKEMRNTWEKLVSRILLPELQNLDKTLLMVNTRISQDERISSDPVAKIIFGDPVSFLPHLPRGSMVHSSKMWACRQRVTLEHLQHIVEQRNGKETVPVLWKFLQKEAELRLVKFLPEILALQRSLVEQFQNVSEVEYQSIRGFIRSQNSDGLKKLLHNRISVFLSTWNKLRRSLETSGEIKLPKEYCSTDLDLDADFEVILPRRRDLGLCSTALVSYLIALHNEMVYTVEKFSNENNSYSIDTSEVTDLHVISYEVERDLNPLVLSNCQYKVEQGGETLQEFDLEKIQRQLTSRFLLGKPRITLKGIPTLVYRRDWNYEHLFVDIKNKMPQNSLPNSAVSTISGQLPSYSDACEALSVIEITLGFLSTAGGDPNMHLNEYIQDMLQMDSQTMLVLKALSWCQLKHTIALWQLLSAHRSEQLLRLNKEPFREIKSRYKADLSPENAKLLRTFLHQTSLDAFLLELHEMMILKLKSPQTEGSFNPEWSLRDTLVSYMETKDSDILPEMESRFPEDIPLSNCVSVWKMAAELKRDRQVR
ncbi:hypothetical protein MUG91_G144n75 [Manis pentadactyla]|nr:hypothetical protein MUG91_G144n75 [Manis pentadactyla]